MVACVKRFAMQLLTAILDWCFPPRPEELLVRSFDPHSLTLAPRTISNDTVSLLPFAHPSVRALVHEAKFFHNQTAHRHLGQIAARYLHTHCATALLIPIPLHPSRERDRGFNQVTASLRTQASLRSHIVTGVLVRHRATKAQSGLNRTERHSNVKAAFRINHRHAQRISAGQLLVLIDDVYTTGATMQAARTALQAAFPHHDIVSLTFAYA